MADQKIKAPDLTEIATAGKRVDLTQGYLANMLVYRNPDEILNKRGGSSLKIYEDLKTDDQVASVFQQRRSALTSKEWGVRAASDSTEDKAIAEFVTEQLKRINFDDKTNKMMFGIFYGYAVAEIMWGVENGMTIISEIKVKKSRRFVFGLEGQLRLLTKENPFVGEEMPDRKFWHFSSGEDNDENPYGIALAKSLFWPVYFKKNGVKFWLVFLEKFGSPTAKAEYPRGATENEKNEILDALDSIQTETSIGVPSGTIIDLLEAKRGGTADYVILNKTMNEAISKVVLSQTMTTDNGSSHSQAKVHQGVKEEIIKADSDLICDSFNEQVIKWLVAYNFPNATPPTVWRNVEQPTDTNQLAIRDKALFDIGYKATQEYIDETYGIGFYEIPQATAAVDASIKPDNANFSDGNQFTEKQMQIEKLADDMLANMSSPIHDSAIASAIRSATSPKDLEARLAIVLKNADMSEFTKQLERGLFAADIMGYAHAR